MLVQRDLWLHRITQALAAHHISLNPPDILLTLERMLTSLELELGESLESGTTAALLLHLLFSCTTRHTLSVKPEARAYLEQRFPRDLACCIAAMNAINQRVPFPFPEEEAYNLLGILKQVDIFLYIGAPFL
jgi:transcriptional regulatory protein LevR